MALRFVCDARRREREERSRAEDLSLFWTQELVESRKRVLNLAEALDRFRKQRRIPLLGLQVLGDQKRCEREFFEQRGKSDVAVVECSKTGGHLALRHLTHAAILICAARLIKHSEAS